MTSLLHVFGDTFPAFGASLLLGAMVVASYTFAVALAAGANGRPRTLQAARFGAYGTVALIGIGGRSASPTRSSPTTSASGTSPTTPTGRCRCTTSSPRSGAGRTGRSSGGCFSSAPTSACASSGSGKRYLELQPYVIATLMAIVLFFCVLMAFAANPFATNVAGARADGEGLNPLLQNYWMVIHPPCLYTGFVGCSVPFAFAVAALVTGRLDHEWIVASRKWTLFAWMFLGIGNTLGMLWAYEELGWGGYWGWDPVENAAFMPFLTASAFVHSVMIQERRGLLKVWNVFLVCLTFFLTIFGTFLTRSGMIASVHSFAQSSIGNYFAAFLACSSWRSRPRSSSSAGPSCATCRRRRGCARRPSSRAGSSSRACGPGLVRHLAACRCPVGVARRRSSPLVAGARRLRRARAGVPADDARARRCASRRPQIESILSREFTFLLNNWVLCSLLFFILVATTFPLISEALTGEKVTVGPALLQGVGAAARARAPLAHGRRARCSAGRRRAPTRLRRAFRAPLVALGVAAALHFAVRASARASRPSSGATPIYPGALGAALRGFNAFTPVLGHLALRLQRGGHRAGVRAPLPRARASRARASDTPAVLWWLGGLPGLRAHAAHAAAASRAAATAGTSCTSASCSCSSASPASRGTSTSETSLSPGQTLRRSTTTRSSTCGARMEVDNNKRMVFADVDVYKDGKLRGAPEPAKFIYKKQPDVADDRGRHRATGCATTLRHRRVDQPAEQDRAPSRSTSTRSSRGSGSGASSSSSAASCACGRSSSSASRASGRARAASRPRRRASSSGSCSRRRPPRTRRRCRARGMHGHGPHRERRRARRSSARSAACAALRARSALDLHVRDGRGGARQDPREAQRGRDARPDHRRVRGRVRARGAGRAPEHAASSAPSGCVPVAGIGARRLRARAADAALARRRSEPPAGPRGAGPRSDRADAYDARLDDELKDLDG